MKSKKKLERSHKKKKWLLAGLIVLSAACAAVVPTVLFLLPSGHTDESSKIQIEFNCEYGFKNTEAQTMIFNVQKGTTLGSLNVPIVDYNKVPATAGGFCGWAPTSAFKDDKVNISNIEKASTKQYDSIKLTAVFKNKINDADSTTWHTVYFTQDPNKKATINENVYIEVPDGYGFKFKDINKPSVSCESGYAFDFWTKNGIDQFLDEALINEDVVVYPKINVTTTMTFVCGDNAKIISGNPTVVAEIGKSFGSLNIPTVEWTGNGNKQFAGWYSEDGILYNNSTIISKTETVYAKWMDNDEAKLNNCSLASFIIPDGETWLYKSNTSLYVSQNVVWKNLFHCEPNTNERSVKKWLMSTNYSEKNNDADWTPVDPETTVIGQFDKVWFKPEMQPAVTDMYIEIYEQEKKVSPVFETGKYFVACSYVFPDSLSQQVNWTIQKWNSLTSQWEDTTGSEVSIINEKNALTSAAVGISVLDETIEKIKIITTAVADSSKTYSKIVIKNDTIAQQPSFYTISNGVRYGLIGLDDKFTNEVSLLNEDGTIKENISKSIFNFPVYISPDVTEIPNNFMANCFAFDNTIAKIDYSLTEITSIGDNFLQNNLKFNNDSVKEIIKNVTTIGSNFMQNNITFNACNLEFSKIQKIGDNFFQNNYSYNQDISFVSKDSSSVSSLKSIGNYFMSDCINFNKDIEFPASLTTLGYYCMSNCDSFTSVIKMSADPSQEGIMKDKTMFSTGNVDSKYGQEGFTWFGYYSKEASLIFDNINDSKLKIYRKSVNTVKPIVGIEILENPIKVQYFVGENFSSVGATIKIIFDDTSTDTLAWDGTKECPWTTSLAEGSKISTAGKQNIILTYKDHSAIIEIDAFEKVSVENLAYCRIKKAGKISVQRKCMNTSFSVDGGQTWTKMTEAKAYSFNKGDVVFFKGTMYNISKEWTYTTKLCLHAGIDIALGGKISSFINDGAEWNQSEVPPTHAFCEFIYGSGSASDPENNPGLTEIEDGFFNINIATTRLYNRAFAANYNLRRIPSSIDITSVNPGAEAACSEIFSLCYNDLGTGLTKLPENFKLPNVSGYWMFRNMFEGCKNLKEVPYNMLPDTAKITSLPESMFNSMFWKCPNLQTAPKIGSYGLSSEKPLLEMFNGCNNLWITDDPDQEGAVEFFTCPSNHSSNAVKSMFASCTNKTKDGHAIWSSDGTPIDGKTYYYIQH